MEPENKVNAAEILRSMKIIHLAIVFSSASLLIISFILISIYGPLAHLNKANSQILLMVGMLIAVLLVTLAYFIHSKRIKQNTLSPFITRLNNYRSSMLLKIALQESALTFLIVIYLLTSIMSMLLGSVILVILLLLNRPGVQLTANELNLSDNEIAQLHDQN
jgi:uncharacterized membrane protein YbhN (UPF0104 family)